MAFCYCSQAWYHARLSEKCTGNAPQLDSGSLVLSFPGHYGAKGTLSPVFIPGNSHEIKLGEAREKGDEFKLNGQLPLLTCLWSIPLAQPSVQYFQDKIGALEWQNCPAKLWTAAFMAKRLESARSIRDVLKNNSGKISCWSECLPQPILLESDFGGALRLWTNSINQKMAPLLPWWYLIFFYIFRIPFSTDTLMF